MPDGEIFKNIKFKFDTLAERMRELAYLNKNIKIKWPNDLIIDRKKICGILTENVFFRDQPAETKSHYSGGL